MLKKSLQFFCLAVACCSTWNAHAFGYLTADSSATGSVEFTLIPVAGSTDCRTRYYDGSWSPFSYSIDPVSIPVDISISRLQGWCSVTGTTGSAVFNYPIIWSAGASTEFSFSTSSGSTTTGTTGTLSVAVADLSELQTIFDTTFSTFDPDLFQLMLFATFLGLSVGVGGGMIYRAVRRA